VRQFDLRSDTVTKPDEGMRKAIHDAEVGDDVYGEDPTVNQLQETAAKLMGKEAALFVTSGSMGNLIPIFLNCGRGNELLAHERAHILHYEMSSLAAIAGAMPVAVPGDKGILKPEQLELRLRPNDNHLPRTRMVEVENTHNLEGGNYYQLEELRDIAGFTKKHKLSLHMDGARIFNAAAGLGVPVTKIASFADTVTFCLSKGLGAPVGSVLCGSEKFIAEAHRVRKLLGGGMRQAGVLAAAGIYALENNVERLVEDHEHAKMIAAALADVEWASLDPADVKTNIIFFDTPNKPAEEVVAALAKRGVLTSALGEYSVRMVTSLAVTRKDVEKVCQAIRTTKG